MLTKDQVEPGYPLPQKLTKIGWGFVIMAGASVLAPFMIPGFLVIAWLLLRMNKRRLRDRWGPPD